MIKTLEIFFSSNLFFNMEACNITEPDLPFEKTKFNPLSNDQIKSLIQEAADLGVKEVLFYINEQTPFNNLPEIEKTANQLNLITKIYNEGPMLSCPEDCDFNDCFSHRHSCFMTMDGSVYPCKGLPLIIGNVQEEPLKKILGDSEIIENLNNHLEMIKGPCRECNRFSHCYGCRGRAFQLTGDYLASDPGCPENKDKTDKITYLPMAINDLIPQQNGMRVVSTLLCVQERFARVVSVFTSESPFIKKDGRLEDVTYMEVMAQSAAVMNGFSKYDTGSPPPGGFLLGGQKIKIFQNTHFSDKLTTDIYKTAKFGSFGILTARIKSNNSIIAEGEIKIFQKDGENNEI